MSLPFYAIVLAGGQSSRLFPFNKVLSDLTGAGRTLLQQSVDRLHEVVPRDQVRIVTAGSFIPAFREQLPLQPAQFLSDPERRGTWPAILWAIADIQQKAPDALIAVVTADHVIPKVATFAAGLQLAGKAAEKGSVVVLLGVTPDRELQNWQSFGVLKMELFDADAGWITDFEEKPSSSRAQTMMDEGGWYWNAGMFIFRISTILEALARFQPAMNGIYAEMRAHIQAGDVESARRAYARFPAKIAHPLNPAREVDNTIDYAIMTPLIHRPAPPLRGVMIQNALPEWTDLGQWTALRGVVKADANGNIRLGDVAVGENVRSCILATDRGSQLTVGGIEGLIVAQANDRLLILPESKVGEVKALAQSALAPRAPEVISTDCTDCRFTADGGRIIALGLRNLSVTASCGQSEVIAR